MKISRRMFDTIDSLSVGVWKMKKCLIVVDYQVDFVTGSLGFEKALSLDSRIARKIKEYRASGGEVIFTMDTHGGDYLTTNEGRHLPAAHCISGTQGHNLFGTVGKAKEQSDRIFCKNTFGSDDLYEHLKKTAYSSIELVGVITNICVISNAVLAKTAQPETDIIVDASCVASDDENLNEAALRVMESLQIQIINNGGDENG